MQCCRCKKQKSLPSPVEHTPIRGPWRITKFVSNILSHVNPGNWARSALHTALFADYITPIAHDYERITGKSKVDLDTLVSLYNTLHYALMHQITVFGNNLNPKAQADLEGFLTEIQSWMAISSNKSITLSRDQKAVITKFQPFVDGIKGLPSAKGAVAKLQDVAQETAETLPGAAVASAISGTQQSVSASPSSIPSDSPDETLPPFITAIHTALSAPIIGSKLFPSFKNTSCTLLEVAASGTTGSSDQARSAKETLIESKNRLQSMQSWDLRKFTDIYVELTQCNIQVDGLFQLPTLQTTQHIRPIGYQLFKLLEILKENDGESHPFEEQEFLRLAQSCDINEVFFESTYHDTYSTHMGREIDRVFSRLKDIISGGNAPSTLSAGTHAVAPTSIGSAPLEAFGHEEICELSQQLYQLIKSVPHFNSFSSSLDDAVSLIRDAQMRHEAATQPDIDARLTARRDLSTRGIIYFASHSLFSYFAPLPPFQLTQVEALDRNDFRKHLINTIGDCPTTKSVVKWVAKKIVPLATSTIAWTVHFYRDRLEAILRIVVDKLAVKAGESTNSDLVSKASHFLQAYTTAHARAGDVETLPFSDALSVELAKEQDHSQISTRIETFVLRELMPSIQLQTLFLSVERDIRRIEDDMPGRQLLGGACRLALSTIRVVILEPVSSLANWTLRRSLRFIMHKTQLIPKLIHNGADALQKNLHQVDQIRESVTRLLQETEFHMRRSKGDSGEETATIDEEDPGAMRQVQGMLSNFIIAYRAFAAVKTKTESQAFCPSKTPSSLVEPFLPASLVHMIQSVLPSIDTWISTFTSDLVVQKLRAAGAHPDVLEKVLRDRIYSTVADVLAKVGTPSPVSTPPISTTNMDESVQKFLQQMFQQIGNSMGQKPIDVFEDFKKWIHNFLEITHPHSFTKKLQDISATASSDDSLQTLRAIKECCETGIETLKQREVAATKNSSIAPLVKEMVRPVTHYLIELKTIAENRYNQKLLKLENEAWSQFNSAQSFISDLEELQQSLNTLSGSVMDNTTAINYPNTQLEIQQQRQKIGSLRTNLGTYKSTLHQPDKHGAISAPHESAIVKGLQTLESLEKFVDVIALVVKSKGLEGSLFTNPASMDEFAQSVIPFTSRETQTSFSLELKKWRTSRHDNGTIQTSIEQLVPTIYRELQSTMTPLNDAISPFSEDVQLFQEAVSQTASAPFVDDYMSPTLESLTQVTSLPALQATPPVNIRLLSQITLLGGPEQVAERLKTPAKTVSHMVLSQHFTEGLFFAVGDFITS